MLLLLLLLLVPTRATARGGSTRNKQSDSLADMRPARINFAAKLALREKAERTGYAVHFGLCEQPTHTYEWQNNRTQMYLLGAAWAPSLPFVEILTFLARHQEAVDYGYQACWTSPPRQLPMCIFPDGSVTKASALWPVPRYTTWQLPGKRVPTTVRFFCPVPASGGGLNSASSSLELRIRDPHPPVDAKLAPVSPAVSVRLCRRRERFQLVTVCPQPLFNYTRIETLWPNIFNEWLAYHRLKGISHFDIYDLYGDFEAPTRPWIKSSGFARYFPRWMQFGPLAPFRKNRYCTEPSAQDHCLFNNMFRSKWIFVLHAPDNFFHFAPAPQHDPLTDINQLLGPLNASDVAEVVIRTQACGGHRKGSGSKSILLTFTHCGQVYAGQRQTPIANTLLTFNTMIHRATVRLPGSRVQYTGAPVAVTKHYMDMVKIRDEGPMPQHFTALHDLQPRILEAAKKWVAEQ
eukprot:TRINITY_DN11793_c0_g1_i1.p1 TRINITY_DN11793_c0_g1~~TRINITY_DN11793_c0_g1_i1.p1  ORF type:complete len:472 (-),score=48.21 TRINITY_DN11793_c0_g1_i1:13-1398(-)